MRKKTSRLIASFLSLVMLFTSVPFTSIAAEEKENSFLPELEIDSEVIADGEFYLGSGAADLQEGENSIYLLKVGRTGDCSAEETVRLSMMDMTAKYGENYTVRLADASLFENKVQNAEDSQSILEVMQSEDVEEYNYSDAVVEGLITAENQLTEEEQLEETEKLQQQIMEADAASPSDVQEQETELPSDVQEQETELPSDEREQETEPTSDAAGEAEDGREATPSDAKTAALSATGTVQLTLAQLKELQTGVESDKTSMTNSGSTDAFGVDWDAFGDENFDPYFTESRDAVLEQLNSAYLEITFKEGVSERYVEIEVIDNESGDGNVQSQFALESAGGSVICEEYAAFTMTIIDDEEYTADTISFSAEEYTPENGYITVTLERSGNLTEMASVEVDTESITAVPSENFAEVHATAIFTFGIRKRTVKIPVISTGLEEDAQFKIMIQEPVGCELGEITEAVCTICPSDVSFETLVDTPTESDLNLSTSSELSLGTDIEEKDNDTPINPGSVFRDKEIKELNSDKYHVRHWNDYEGSTYYDGGRKAWQLYARKWPTGPAYATVTFTLSPKENGKKVKHLDWSGVTMRWEKDNGGSFYNQQCRVTHCYQGKDTSYMYTEDRNFGQRTDNFFVDEDYVDEVEFKLIYEMFGGPHLYIYGLLPIKRIFEFELLDSEPIELIDENGKKIKNTDSTNEAYKTAHLTHIQSGDEKTNKLYMISGRYITVALDQAKDDRISYIAGLQLEYNGQKKIIWTAPDGQYPSEYAFELTNDFLLENEAFLELVKNGGNGKMGKMKIRAIVKNIPITVDVKTDDRLEFITLWDGLNPQTGAVIPKTGVDLKNGTIRYTYSRGDVIRYQAKLKSQIAAAYEWRGIDVSYYQKEKQQKYTLWDENREGFVQEKTVRSSQTVAMHIEDRNNDVVVKVSKADDRRFDHNEGFYNAVKSQKTEGQYICYTLDRDRAAVKNNVYELQAKLKQGENLNTALPVWEEAFHSGQKYGQSTYYFEGKLEPKENVVTLSIRDGAEMDSYQVTGTIYYDTALLGESKTEEGWIPATGVQVDVDGVHFGIADNTGKFTTTPFNSCTGMLVKMRVGIGGSYMYRAVRLGSSMTADSGRYVLSAFNSQHPRFTTLSVYAIDKSTGQEIRRPVDYIVLGNESEAAASVLYAKTTDKDAYGQNFTYTYIDNGEKKTATEKVKRVEFVVYDSKTHKEKGIYKVETQKADGTWEMSSIFSRGKYAMYAPGDRLYARVVTDRKQDNGTKVVYEETYYPPVNTGVGFSEKKAATPPITKVPISTDGKHRLPVIGSLTTMLSISYLSLGIEQTHQYGIRVYFGAAIPLKGSHFDENGMLKKDTEILYKTGNLRDGVQEMINQLSTFDDSESGKHGLGLPAWSFTPIAGVYFEFAIVYVDTSVGEQQNGRLRYRYIGGGAYAGFIGNFRYTYYMVLGFIPTYIGGDVTLQMMVELGAARKNDTSDRYFESADQTFVNKLLEDSYVNFIYRANFYANAYAGIGVCQTAGIRGGFALTFYFITNPMIRKTYPDVHSTGFHVNGTIKFWADAVLLTVPIPVFEGKTWKRGYFKDIDKYGLSEEETVEEEGSEESVKEIIQKERLTEAAKFIANDCDRETVKNLDEIFDGSILNRRIIANAYDDASVQMADVTSSDKDPKTVLMVYLEDDTTRQGNERTRLMYTVYTDDGENGKWSDPIPVDLSGQESETTADFSPNLCDCGKYVRITWISRDKKLEPDGNNYADYLRSLQLYTTTFDKDSGKIGEVQQLTADPCMYANPKAVYDAKSDKTFLFYLRSEVTEIQSGKELIMNAVPQYNKAEVAFRVFDGEKKEWMTDYLENELPKNDEEAELLKNQLKGERFINSQIEQLKINNPVISDYDLIIAPVHMSDDELLFYLCKEADVDHELVQKEDPDAVGKLKEFIKTKPEFVKDLGSKTKNMGVFAYTVDADNDLSTTADQEIWLQFFDPADHEFEKPRQVTKDGVGQSSIKLVSNGETVYLFWLEDGEERTESMGDETETVQETARTLQYLDVVELAGADGSIPVSQSPGLLTAGNKTEGSALNGYGVFADSDGSLYVVWKENTAETVYDRAEDAKVQQDLFVSVRKKEDASAKKGEEPVSGTAWSDGIRVTCETGVNEIPAIAELSDGVIVMVSNNYVVDMQSESTKIPAASLNEILFIPVGAAVPHSVSAVRLPEKEGQAFDLSVTFRNDGDQTTGTFKYELQLFDGTTPVTDMVSGTVAAPLAPANTAEVTEKLVLRKSIAPEEGNLVLVATTVPAEGVPGQIEPICRQLKLEQMLPSYTFENVTAVQEDDCFCLEGTVVDSGLIKGDPEDKLIIEDADGEFLYSRSLSELSENRCGFTAQIPITEEMIETGRSTMTIRILRNGQECSDPYYITAYMERPIDLKITGAEEGRLKLKQGETLELETKYKQPLYFGESRMLYSVDDSLIAGVDGNTLTAYEPGVTTLSVTTEQFGGQKTVQVTVLPGDVPPVTPTEKDPEEGIETPKGPAGAQVLEGSWKQNDDGSWSFIRKDGRKATGWGRTGAGSETEYWHFNEKGIMDTGWYMDTAGAWYYLHEASDGRKGAMDRGWHFEQSDGKWYYLDPENGKMKTGWICDNRKWYYLTETAGTPCWSRDAGGRWIYSGSGRSYGSMYANETTPDGKKVDADGARVGR